MSSATSEPSGVVGRDEMAFATPKAAKKRRGAALKPAPSRDPASDSGAFQPRPSPEAEVQPPVPPPRMSPEPRALAVGEPQAPLAAISRRTASSDTSDAAASTPVPLPTVFAQPKKTATASEPPVEIIKPSSTVVRAAEPTMEPVLASTTAPKPRRTAAIDVAAGGSAKPSEPETVVDEADNVPEPRVSKVRRTAAVVVPKGPTPGLDNSETGKPGEDITPNPLPEPIDTISESGGKTAPQEPAAGEDEMPEPPLPRISKTRRTAAIVVPNGPTPGMDDSETRKPGEDITADQLPEPTDAITESGGKIPPQEPAAAEDETSEAPLPRISKTRRAAAIVVPKGPAPGEDPESTAKPEDTTTGLVTRGRKPTSDPDPGAAGLSIQTSTASPPPPAFDRAATSKTYAIDNTTKSRLSPPAFDRAATSKTYAVDNTTRAAILNKSREERSELVPLPEAAKPTTSAGGPGLVSRGRSRVSEPDTGAARLPLKTRSHSPPPPTPPKFDRAATSGTQTVDNTATAMLADLGDPTKKPSRTVSRGMSPAPAKGRRGLRKKRAEDDANGLGRTNSHSPTRRNDGHSQVSDASGNDSKLPPPTLESSADVAQSPAGLDLDRNVSGDYGDVFATKASTFHQNVSEAFSDLSLGDSTHQHFAGEGGQQRRGSNEMDGSGPGRSKARQSAMRRTNSFGDAKGKAGNQSAMDGSNDSAAYAKKNSAMDGSNYSAAYSRVSTPSKPGAFSAAGRGLRKNKVNDDVSVANSKTSDAAPQVGAFAATGRGLRKKQTADEGGSDRSLETGTGTADASSVPAATGLRAARQQARMNAENAKARKGGRSLSPVPGLMRHHADSKDGPPQTITLGSSSPKPRNSLASSVASSVLATELLKEMVEEGHIPTAMPDLDSVTKSVGSGTNGKKAGTLQFFGQSGAAASTANINEISDAIAEEAEADMLLKIASKTRGEQGESVNKTGGKAPGQVIHVTQEPVDNTQAVERQESAGIRYSNQGVPDKRTIPPGYDGPGAYSGTQGNQYDRNSSIHFETINLSAHTGDGAAPRESTRSSRSSSKSLFDADVEQARRRESELGDIKEESSSRKTLYLGIGFLLVVIVVIAVVVAVVAGGGGDNDGGEAAKEATPIPEADPTEAPAQPVDFDESVIPTLSDTSIGVSTIATIVDDPTSPQALAFAWVAEDPNLQDYSGWRRLQRFALATFYHSFNGPKWKASDDQAKNWMSYEVDECDWFPYETACSEDGRVRYIRFNRLSQFRGSVPPELVLLEQLDEMDLSNNILNSVDVLLTRSMPASLRILRCSLCRLGGPIPSQIGLVSSLQALVLSENSITGSLPSELAQLTRMDSLLLNDNAIGGSLPLALGGMNSMINLALDSNSFTGAIPVELLTSMPILESLGLGFNSLADSIPSEIGLLTSLVRADLESNSLTGSLPSEVGLMAKLTSLDLLGNGLVGRVPTELGQLGALRALGLASNSLSVTIPTQLGTATALVSMDMAVNKLTGTVPSELGQLVHLEQLTLFGNSLTGNIPSEVSALPKLTLLKVFGS